MEYGDIVRLEVAANLTLSQKERERFARESESMLCYFDTIMVKKGMLKRKRDAAIDMVTIPSSMLRKDISASSQKLDEIFIMPEDLEGRSVYAVNPLDKKNRGEAI